MFFLLRVVLASLAKPSTFHWLGGFTMKQYDLTDTLPFDQSCALAVAWENFVSKLPKDQQEDVRSRPPSLSSVHNAVQSASRLWQDKRDNTKRGKLKNMFARVAKSCDDHSDLLSIIPKDDKYVSLIAGSLSSIVKVRLPRHAIGAGTSPDQVRLPSTTKR
jgi:hypothetical protein